MIRFIRMGLIALVLCGALPSAAQDRVVTLAAPEALVEIGFLKYILPRFSLKNSIRVTLVPEAEAQAVLTSEAKAAFTGKGASYGLDVREATDFTAKFAEWLYSDSGMRAIQGFKIDGAVMFGPPDAVVVEVAPVVIDGNAKRGEDLSLVMCGRCHVVSPRNRMSGIGSTPSFAVMKTFSDWQERFSAFYVLKPHGAFTQIEDVTPPFDPEHPPNISPIELTLDDLENILAYVAGVPPADLGAPIQSQ